MEIIRGKHVSFMDTPALAQQLAGYDAVHIDIGTGDGRYVQHLAQTHPQSFMIGIDACRENLREVSRRAPANALFVIANARFLPAELHGAAAQVTINFPWGSLLNGLLADDPLLLSGIGAIARADNRLDIRLNAGALAEAGWSLEEGTRRVRDVLRLNGFDVRPPVTLTARELKACPTTWARRLAFGRDPRATYLCAVKQNSRIRAAQSA